MQRNGVPMLYDSASIRNYPSLYICPVSNILGRVPLIPCFVAGNKHPTLLILLHVVREQQPTTLLTLGTEAGF